MLSNVEVHNEAKTKVQEWLEREELMWQQRSKIILLKKGYRNSKYFPAKA